MGGQVTGEESCERCDWINGGGSIGVSLVQRMEACSDLQDEAPGRPRMWADGRRPVHQPDDSRTEKGDCRKWARSEMERLDQHERRVYGHKGGNGSEFRAATAQGRKRSRRLQIERITKQLVSA